MNRVNVSGMADGHRFKMVVVTKWEYTYIYIHIYIYISMYFCHLQLILTQVETSSTDD